MSLRAARRGIVTQGLSPRGPLMTAGQGSAPPSPAMDSARAPRCLRILLHDRAYRAEGAYSAYIDWGWGLRACAELQGRAAVRALRGWRVFLSVIEAGLEHLFFDAAGLHKVLLEANEILIEQVVGLMKQAEGDVRDGFSGAGLDEFAVGFQHSSGRRPSLRT